MGRIVRPPSQLKAPQREAGMTASATEEGGSATEIEGVAPSNRALFAGIDDRGFDGMLRIGREVSFGRGEVVFEARDRADGMYVPGPRG
jgi:hypothetical protein